MTDEQEEKSQPVRLTGGTMFIGMLVFLIWVESCGTNDHLRSIEKRLETIEQKR